MYQAPAKKCMGEGGGGEAKKLSYPYVIDRVGEVNDIRITVYNPRRHAQYVPLHFPSISSLNGVPSASRVILAILRIPSLAQSSASRAVTVIPDLIGVVISRHRRAGAQHIGAVDNHSRGARTLWRRIVSQKNS